MSHITVLWHEAGCKNYTDILPLEWFINKGPLLDCVHDVRGPRAGSYMAKCDVSVQDTYADLDYAMHEKFNLAHEMDLGVLRLHFDSQARRSVTQVLWREKGKARFRPAVVTVILEPQREFSESEEPEDAGILGKEGRKYLVSHLKRERDPKLVAAKKASVLKATGRLACEACGFGFPEKYGALGEGFCEVHHRITLSSRESTTTTLGDLAIVCSNCHRMIHRTGEPMFSIEAFAQKYLPLI